MANLPLKHLFDLPEGVIYLDGNSLGPLPKAVPARIQGMITDEWGGELIRGWNTARWMEQPLRVGNKIAPLIGAAEGTVVMGDTLSIKVYQALAAALAMRPDRRVILSDNGNFPTDLYMAEGLIGTLGKGHRLELVEPEAALEAITEDTAAVMLTHVDYRTGRLHDMDAISARAAEKGAVMIWDLAHSAGALPVDITATGAEFAVGCSYKYLNGGPGAPAFIYVRSDIADSIQPALSGWLGHEAPFAFDLDYRPGQSIERMRVGTPPVIQMTALETALEVWEHTTIQDIRQASIALTEAFIQGIEAKIPELTLASPRDPTQRGSQVSFHFPDGYAAMQAVIARGVIGDFRAPDIMRFGFTPLFIGQDDVESAVEIIADVITSGIWKEDRFQTRQAVT